MKLSSLLGLLVLFVFCVVGEEPNLLPDPGLTNPKIWPATNGYRIESGAGRDGANALIYERTDPMEYPLPGVALKLAPGAYEFGGWAFCDPTQGKNVGAAICIEMTKNGKFEGGSYGAQLSGPGDWRYMEDVIVIPAEGKFSVRFIPYMQKGNVGKVKFSDMFIRRQQPQLHCAIVSPRMIHAIPAGNVKFEVAFQVQNLQKKSEGNHLKLEIRKGETILAERQFLLNPNIVTFEFQAVESGAYELNGSIVDAAGKSIAADKIPFSVQAPKAPAAVSIDEKGRMIVGNQKFFPLGLYCHRQENEKYLTLEQELDELAKSKFNCLLPYDWTRYRVAGSKKQGMDAAREVFDAIQAKGLKIIPSIGYHLSTDQENAREIINALSAHPALLCWYIYDEQPITQREKMLATNAVVNLTDPNHPTAGACCHASSLFQYLGTAGIVAYDTYPIYRGTDSIASLDNAFAKNCPLMSANGHPSFWFVPQWINWAAYHKVTPEAARKLFRWPTPDEAEAMSLLSIIYGAKGIIFYSFFDQFRPENQFQARWPELCQVAAELSELAPYVLGDADPATPHPLKSSGQIRTRLFRSDDGRDALVIVALGPGKATAEFTLPGTWISRRGKTIRQPSGKYCFTAGNIDCDILYQKK